MFQEEKRLNQHLLKNSVVQPTAGGGGGGGQFSETGGWSYMYRGFPKPTHFWGVSLIVLNFRYDL